MNRVFEQRAIGPVNVRISADRGGDLNAVTRHYPAYPRVDVNRFSQVSVHIAGKSRTWSGRHQPGRVILDDGTFFSEFPVGAPLPYVEWAINWCVATRCHRYLMFHAAVVRRGDTAVALPGLPGSGKSTLCAYLISRGWVLMSDEFCIIDPQTLRVVAFPRLIPLKNESIGVIRTVAPGLRLGPEFPGTRKGTVCHVIPPDDMVGADPGAELKAVVLVKFNARSRLEREPLSQARCFIELSNNAFNYSVLGHRAFEATAKLARSVSASRLEYARLEDAEAALLEIHGE